ncbi:uncharacterized protein F5147DRAFT_774179 [Suillus discolor]|uniref:Uncharacterized protein n=1 Tax=Suillus discolor TaxID=1912936 RepID=A0A9P7JTQ5_9AGAM|nr:uncharacterized protein F5147DRAFT_774179 [Suillus discolor]KAG2107734.1 hypothetical protein F5147DRAFT_774179 [Suillus discolor]
MRQALNSSFQVARVPAVTPSTFYNPHRHFWNLEIAWHSSMWMQLYLQFTVGSGRYRQPLSAPTRPPSFSAINRPFFHLPPVDLSFPSPKVTSPGLELTPADESGPRRSKRSLDLPKQQYLSANEPITSEFYKGMERLNSYICMLPEAGYMILLTR